MSTLTDDRDVFLLSTTRQSIMKTKKKGRHILLANIKKTAVSYLLGREVSKKARTLLMEIGLSTLHSLMLSQKGIYSCHARHQLCVYHLLSHPLESLAKRKPDTSRGERLIWILCFLVNFFHPGRWDGRGIQDFKGWLDKMAQKGGYNYSPRTDSSGTAREWLVMMVYLKEANLVGCMMLCFGT